jgi:hypothetical protein
MWIHSFCCPPTERRGLFFSVAKSFLSVSFRLGHFYWSIFKCTDSSVVSILLFGASGEVHALVIAFSNSKLSIWFFWSVLWFPVSFKAVLEDSYNTFFKVMIPKLVSSQHWHLLLIFSLYTVFCSLAILDCVLIFTLWNLGPCLNAMENSVVFCFSRQMT